MTDVTVIDVFVQPLSKSCSIFKRQCSKSAFQLCDRSHALGDASTLASQRLSAFRDPMSYTRNWYDLDVTDPLPDLWRLINGVVGTIKGRRSIIGTSIPAELIPPFEESKVS